MRVWRPFAWALMFLLAGCGTGGVGTAPDTTPKSKQKETPVKIEPKVADTTLSFGLELLNRLDDPEEGNRFLSPLSVSLAMSMVLNGAQGETYEQIAKTVGYHDLSLEQVNAQASQLMNLLRKPDPKTQVEVANSLWIAENFALEADFIARLQRFYGATAENLDFAHHPDASAQRINAWVREQTHELIPRLFEEDAFAPETIAVLVNTLYFKGKWQHPFAKEATQEMPFQREDGSTQPVPMMMASGKYPYYKGDGFQAVLLPYGTGDLQFYLILPEEGLTVAQLRSKLTPERWKQMVAGFEPKEGDVGLPRFRIESQYALETVLAKMGMPLAFTPGEADFSGMNRSHGKQIYIHSVVHKAVVQVDEEGTEAAAATGVEMRITSATPDTFTLIANRPFLFAIVHRPTGLVLFLGIVRTV